VLLLEQHEFKKRIKTCPNPECGYEWLARTPNPHKCPRCQTSIQGSKIATLSWHDFTNDVPFEANLRSKKYRKIIEKADIERCNFLVGDFVPLAEAERECDVLRSVGTKAVLVNAELRKELNLIKERIALLKNVILDVRSNSEAPEDEKLWGSIGLLDYLLTGDVEKIKRHMIREKILAEVLDDEPGFGE
jgi:hypothetical protein